MITLLTDFGLEDSFVGTLKGVIYRINPDVKGGINKISKSYIENKRGGAFSYLGELRLLRNIPKRREC